MFSFGEFITLKSEILSVVVCFRMQIEDFWKAIYFDFMASLMDVASFNFWRSLKNVWNTFLMKNINKKKEKKSIISQLMKKSLISRAPNFMDKSKSIFSASLWKLEKFHRNTFCLQQFVVAAISTYNFLLKYRKRR